MLNANLSQAYAEQQANAGDGSPYTAGITDQRGLTGAAQNGAQTELDPNVKTLIAQQVKTDLAEMQTASSTVASDSVEHQPIPSDDSIPDVLKPGHTAFEVSTDMQLSYGDNQTCSVTPGDVLFRKPGSTTDATGAVEITVVGSKPGSCDLNTSATVTLATLQDMNNQFEEQLQGGLEVLAAKAGNGTIPASPTPGKIEVADGQAPAQDVNALISQNQQSGQQAEVELASVTSSSGNH